MNKVLKAKVRMLYNNLIGGKEIFTVVKLSPEKKTEAPMGFKPKTCNTGAMLYQLSYEASLKQVKCEFNLYPLCEENDLYHIHFTTII